MSRAYSLFNLIAVAQKRFGTIEVQTRTLKVRQIICKVQVVGYILIINTKIKIVQRKNCIYGAASFENSLEKATAVTVLSISYFGVPKFEIC